MLISDEARVYNLPSLETRHPSKGIDQALPLVSIITPTKGRSEMLRRLWSCVREQDYSRVEWLIEDDSVDADPFFATLSDARVHYSHSGTAMTIGAKRNIMVGKARGGVIAHFDDDDYYSPSYVTQQLSFLTQSDADIIKLAGFYIWDRYSDSLFYWDQTASALTYYSCRARTPVRLRASSSMTPANEARHRLGYGFSYLYKKAVWAAKPFDDVDFCEDLAFMQQASRRFSVQMCQDMRQSCLHIIHNNNMSGCFPQFLLPRFLRSSLFPAVI